MVESAVPPPPTEAVVGFIRVLREAGLRAPTSSAVLFSEAIAVLGWANPDHVYWAARATLCRRPEDGPLFDVCFWAWFSGRDREAEYVTDRVEVVVALDDWTDLAPSDDVEASGATTDDPVVVVRFSRTDVLRHRDFALYSAADHLEARAALRDLRITGERRRSRRLVRTHTRRRPDVRRTMRAAMRTEGEPLRRAYRTPTTRARQLVVLCDVSGSMEPYSRVIVRFLHAAVVARRRVEAFVLGTRLTRVTRELANRDPDAALAAAARRVTDWSGGTRLGETLQAFNDQWGMRGMARGAVVVIVSDGWDRGEPEVLGEQMQRLARVARRIVWVNPLKATKGFAPLAAGMAAALPYVDDFIEGHSLAALDDLVAVIEGAAR